MKSLIGAAALFAAVATATSTVAAPTLIDFETFVSATTAYSVSGVTFTSGAGGTIIPIDGPNGSRNMMGNYVEISEDPYDAHVDPFLATFDALQGFVSVDLGDYADREYGDEDLLFLEIFDAANVSLGRTELLIGPIEPDYKTLSITGPGIKSATFGSIGGLGSSVYADNFRFDAAVPEPGAWALMLLGFGGIGAMLRTRRTALAG
jgi:hypothetical protein